MDGSRRNRNDRDRGRGRGVGGAPPLPMAANDIGGTGDWGVVPLENGGGGGALARNQAAWREREQRQRSVRFMMMMLLMMLLMDDTPQGDPRSRQEREQHFNQHRHRTPAHGDDNGNGGGGGGGGGGLKDGPRHGNLRRSPAVERLASKPPSKDVGKQPRAMNQSIYRARREQDERIATLSASHPRYQRLVGKNEGKDFESILQAWAYENIHHKNETAPKSANEAGEQLNGESLENEKQIVHYPWNATGLYRGTWEAASSKIGVDEQSREEYSDFNVSQFEIADPSQLKGPMTEALKSRGELVGVRVLPPLARIGYGANASNIFVSDNGHIRSNKTKQSSFWWWLTFSQGPPPETKTEEKTNNMQLPLTQSSGQASIQLNVRSVPAINEISLLEGFVKLYDSSSIGYSTQRDILMRVSGVLIHSIGRISLVSSPFYGRTAMVIADPPPTVQSVSPAAEVGTDTERRRRLSDLVDSVAGSKNEAASKEIRDETISLVGSNQLVVGAMETGSIVSPGIEGGMPTSVFPYPYVPDDDDRNNPVRARGKMEETMREREKQFEANTGICEFEITLDVSEVSWSVKKWRDLIRTRVEHSLRLDPGLRHTNSTNKTETDTSARIGEKVGGGYGRKRIKEEQALAMELNGTIISTNCNFFADLNVSAIRTDWDLTMRKGVNYSFVMMLTCLTQIVLLLRQLLHTQSQSAAVRMSLLCIGWQTVLDALLCLTHIYLSLAMKPLFTAFASVAFFKLLIFCVIEMKYMAIIIQARNSNNGGVSATILRRQVAMLHLRFYVALVGSFLAFYYAGERYRIFCLFIMYSFWVPMIALNVQTQARRCLHKHFLYGMSISRLVAPLYAFGVGDNFLSDAYRINMTDRSICVMLILWVGLQTAILVGQEKRGARFMIPARLLPPKFDYGRPIPDSLIEEASNNNDEQDSPPSVSLERERAIDNPNANVQPLIARDTSPHNRSSTGVTRNRIKGSKATRPEVCMTAETVNSDTMDPSMPKFDCAICYNQIDIRNRTGYMLAPCNHLFHKDCLVQWMDIKMECPVCRKDLPAI